MRIYYFLHGCQILKRETYPADGTSFDISRRSPPQIIRRSIQSSRWASIAGRVCHWVSMTDFPWKSQSVPHVEEILRQFSVVMTGVRIDLWLSFGFIWIPTLTFSHKSLLDLRGMIFVSSLAWRLIGDKCFVIRFFEIVIISETVYSYYFLRRNKNLRYVKAPIFGLYLLYVWGLKSDLPPRKMRNHPKLRPPMNSSPRINPIISMLKLRLGPYIHGDPARHHPFWLKILVSFPPNPNLEVKIAYFNLKLEIPLN